MTRTRMKADKRKAEIIKVAAQIANVSGLSSVSCLSIAPFCSDITARGIRYHFPNKTLLYQSIIDSDLLTIKAMNDAVKVGLIIDDGEGNLTA